MSIRVLVTGATGFTGKYVVKELCSQGFRVTCFVRQSSDRGGLAAFPAEYIVGDLDDYDALRDALDNHDVLVNIASLGFGHAAGIVKACQEANIKRAVFFSTTAVLTTLAAPSKIVRTKAEQLIRESNINYTIIRPTMIYGSLGDRNMIRLIRFIYRSPVVPIFGDGKSLLQPVCVQDLAKAVSSILKNDNTKNKVYHLSGKEPLTYNEVIDTVAEKLRKRVIKIHIPVKLSLLAIRVARYIPGLPHITPEQVLRLNENKAFSHEKAGNDFSYSPLSFADGISREVSEFEDLKKSGK